MRRAFLPILIGAAILRFLGITDPIATRWITSWREGDVGAIARNFLRDGLDPFHPRIDWRRDGPGYVESEFPFGSYALALAERGLGEHEPYGRWGAAAISVAALVVFARMVRRRLPPEVATLALVFVAINPALLHVATGVQPEPLLVLFSLLAMERLWAWDERPASKTLVQSCAWIALAILAKTTAAHLGFVVAFVVLRKFGLGSLRRRDVWLGASVALAAPLAWYAWSHRFWLLYGNSLGLSNETHWIGWDVFTNPRFVEGLARQELEEVLGPFGLFFVMAALVLRPRASAVVAGWLVSAWLLYAVAIRSSSEAWASYYHVISAMPASILMAHGVVGLWTIRPRSSRVTRGAIAVAVALNSLLLVFHVVERHRERFHGGELLRARACRTTFEDAIPPGERMIFPGGDSRDEDGYPVAYDVSWMFYFVDRQGFTIPTERWNAATISDVASRGGRFLFWKKGTEKEHADLDAWVRTHASLRADCDGYQIFDLASPPARDTALDEAG